MTTQSLERHRLAVHSRILKKAQGVVGKHYEGYFVLALRTAEGFCQFIYQDDEIPYGLTPAEVGQLTERDLEELYKFLLTFYSLVLTGTSIPGTQRERLALTSMVVDTDQYFHQVVEGAAPELCGMDLVMHQMNRGAAITAQILRISVPNFEQLRQTLMYTAFEVLGMQAARLGLRRPCFVATAVFETELHPTVCILRDFRDKVLARSSAGKRFVQIYNRIGPTLARSCLAVGPLRFPLKFVLTVIALVVARSMRQCER